MATVTEKRMIYLISETIKPTIDSVKLFKESMRHEYVTDPLTGEKYPVIKWTQALSNGSKKTGNNNLFMKMDVEPAILDPYVQNRVKKGAFTNEYNHPLRDNPERYVQVWDRYTSDKITRFWYEGMSGDDILFGECETLINDYGPQLRKKIIGGAVPAKSLRASGEVYRDSSGRERKKLNIMAYDNVFMPADPYAWGDMNSSEQASYCESMSRHIEKIEANSGIQHSKKLFLEGNIAIMSNKFEELEMDRSFIAESIGVNVDRAIIDPHNKNTIAYYGESVTVVTTVEEKLRDGLLDFLRK